MFRSKVSWITCTCLALGLMGCGQANNASTRDTKYVVSSEPTGAIPVGEARKNVKDRVEVTLIGRIGGSAKPFVDGIAAFTIVDTKVKYCADEEGCPTPWDYCCAQDEVKHNIAMVKVVDSNGKPVEQDARTLLGVKELSTVVVRGTAARDSEGNLSILSDQVFVKD